MTPFRSIIAIALLFAVPAWAEDATIAAGRAAMARVPSPENPGCAACHGQDGAGQPEAGVPELAGFNAAYIAEQLDFYASGQRESATMGAFAKALSPADRKAIAAYLASLPAAAHAAPSASPEQLKRGEELFQTGDYRTGALACALCHGRTGLGVGNFSPRLAGQSAGYTQDQLALWAKGGLRDPKGEFMKAVASHLSPADIATVSAYAAAMKKGDAP